MQKLFILPLLISALIIPSLAFSQQLSPCGTTREDLNRITERLLENQHLLATHQVQDRNEIIYVPITMHIVGESTTGIGSVSELKVLEMLCGINEFYFPQDIQFYIKRFNYIKNTSLYNNPLSFGGEAAMSSNKKFDSINMYLPNSAGDPGTLGYYLQGNNYENDWIVISKNQVSYGAASTPAHELGHFFSLLHTFNGWECDNYNASIHGTQVALLAPCPNMDPPFGAVQNECQDQSNCTIAGDFICDTPPDYNFGFGFNPPCGNYPSNTVMDPCGAYVNPDEQNMMGYFIGCSDYHFSQGQQDLIYTDLVNNNKRNYLESAYVPNTTEITGTVTLNLPANNATDLPYNSITFNWSAVPGADKYLLEIDRFTSFTVDPYRVIVNGTTKTVSDYFEDNKIYKWRVTPFNEYYTCATSSSIFSLTTGDQVSVREISGMNQWDIAPNPLQMRNDLSLIINADMAFDARIQLTDMSGRLVISRQIEVAAGDNQFTISIPCDIASGLYLVSILNADGVMNKKLVIAE